MTPAAALRDTLVRWYRAHARDLPWRRGPDAYRVLVSELMLQQTRVETVIPYFERFLSRFPTVEALAEAPEDDVLHAWQGLGYYRRARHLHAAARAVVARGGFPRDVDGLRALPGVGAYTAGAIASIAFGVAAPAVDGNVNRVIARVDGIDLDPARAPGRRAIDARVAAIQHASVASDVTQGLMELGATVCTPRQAACPRCPWRAVCVARATDRVEVLPALAARKAPVAVEGVAARIVDGSGRVLIGRRPAGLLGGLWEPVLMERALGEDPQAALDRLVATRAGGVVREAVRVGEVVHVFTHRRLRLDVYVVDAALPEPLVAADGYTDLAWRSAHDASFPLSRLAHRVLDAGAEDAQGAHPMLPWGEPRG